MVQKTVRDLGFISWKQESAWMESMSGVRWNKMVEKENSTFLKQLEVSSEVLNSKISDFKNAKKQVVFSYESVIINYINSFEIEWYYKDDESKKYVVSDICIYKDKVYQVRDVGEGAQKYRLECLDSHKVLWYINNVGPNIIIKDNLSYFLNCENCLWYNSFYCVDADSGKSKTLIYEELNNRFNLNLIKGDNDCIFLLRENALGQNLFVIEQKKIVYRNELLQYYVPIGYYKNKICYLYLNNSFWNSSGFTLKKKFNNNILYASLFNNVLIMIENGLKKMYDFNFKLLCTYYGNFIYNNHSTKHFERYFIDIAGAGIIEYKYHTPIECISYYGNVKRILHNKVPIIIVAPHCKPKGLMCIGYGAYNIPTSMSTTRWKPYIDAGWIIAFICVRGSGDVNKSWTESAKTYNKEASFIDFESCISVLQKRYGISPKHTCIYGRSAGGYLVGGVLSRNPSGNLFKMVYAEVPYVDVLRTTTNSKLPLTSLEYDEFGNPSDGIFQFRTIMDYSPVDSLDYNRPPDLYVLIRTSENDSQVYTYESYKWLEALRGKNTNDTRKIVYNTKNKGHFVNSAENYSQDFFLLNSFRVSDE